MPGNSTVSISKEVQRRFILGKQGLYPGRRWQGKDGVVQAIREGCIVQEEADDFFALKLFHKLGIITARDFRGWFAGRVERSIDTAEASARLEAMRAAGQIVPISLKENAKTPYFMLADDLPLLEMLCAGQIPGKWQGIDTTTSDEMIFLAPLEIVTARGRAQLLFDFEYLWEVYKPVEKRRWGYYTLPILYQDRLVARLDPRFERSSATLLIKGFWLEYDSVVDDRFLSALTAGLLRFMGFVGASAVELPPLCSEEIREGVLARLNTASAPGKSSASTL